MALSAQNSRSHSYTRVPKHDDFVEAPYYPFVSEAVRMDAIEHLWTYQELALPYSDEDLGGEHSSPPFIDDLRLSD